MGIEDVSAFLGHDKISTTEEYYAPWVWSRQIRLEGVMRGAWAVMLKKTPGLGGIFVVLAMAARLHAELERCLLEKGERPLHRIRVAFSQLDDRVLQLGACAGLKVRANVSPPTGAACGFACEARDG